MDLKQLIINAINSITSEKQSKKIEPTYAISLDVFREVQKQIPGITTAQYKAGVNSLVKAGKIEYGQTINNIYLKLKQ